MLFFIKVCCIVADSASNVKSAIHKFPDHVEKIACCCHRINLCANDLFKIVNVKERIVNDEIIFSVFDYNEDDELRKIIISKERKEEIELTNSFKEILNSAITKCKHLVSSFRHSDKLLRIYKEKQEYYQLPRKIKLVQCVPTRWNSVLDMINSILINKEVLCSMAVDRQCNCIKNYVPNDNEFSVLKDLAVLLEPLKELTVLLSGHQYNTISLLYPGIYYLLNKGLIDIEIESREIKNLKTVLKSSLTKRFRNVFSNDLFIAATFLNYKYKKLQFIENEVDRLSALNKARQYLNTKFNNSCFNNLSVSPSTSQINLSVSSGSSSSFTQQPLTPLENQTREKPKKRTFLDKIADKKVPQITIPRNELETEISEYEIHDFSLDESLDESDSSLVFFKMNKNKYKILGSIAKRIFCIPSSSVPVESLFSDCGQTASELRTKLTPLNLKSCVFYKVNRRYF